MISVRLLRQWINSFSSSCSTSNGVTTVDTFDGFVIALHRKMVSECVWTLNLKIRRLFFSPFSFLRTFCHNHFFFWLHHFCSLPLYFLLCQKQLSKSPGSLFSLQIRMDVYFLSSQKSRPSLFGTPLILPCDESTTNQDLYGHVWTQVSRLVSPLPPSESNTPNHAQDWQVFILSLLAVCCCYLCRLLSCVMCPKSSCSDDSLGYEYPFALKIVQKDGFTCTKCPWYR